MNIWPPHVEFRKHSMFYVSSFTKQPVFVNHARIRSCKQTVYTNKSKVSCSMKQQVPCWSSNSLLVNYESDVLHTRPNMGVDKRKLNYRTTLYIFITVYKLFWYNMCIKLTYLRTCFHIWVLNKSLVLYMRLWELFSWNHF